MNTNSSLTSLALMVTALHFGSGCSEEEERGTEPPSPVESARVSREARSERGAAREGDALSGAEEAAMARTRDAARELGSTLESRLLSAMRESGPVGALEMCSAEAQALTAGVGRETGVTVGRASLRLRNPENAPPPWVEQWLSDHGPDARAEGVTGFARVVDTSEGRRARVLRPIAMKGPCLNCHGSVESLDPDVRAVLEERYPEDEATGYAVGDLRGALYAESPPIESEEG